MRDQEKYSFTAGRGALLEERPFKRFPYLTEAEAEVLNDWYKEDPVGAIEFDKLAHAQDMATRRYHQRTVSLDATLAGGYDITEDGEIVPPDDAEETENWRAWNWRESQASYFRHKPASASAVTVRFVDPNSPGFGTPDWGKVAN